MFLPVLELSVLRSNAAGSTGAKKIISAWDLAEASGRLAEEAAPSDMLDVLAALQQTGVEMRELQYVRVIKELRENTRLV